MDFLVGAFIGEQFPSWAGLWLRLQRPQLEPQGSFWPPSPRPRARGCRSRLCWACRETWALSRLKGWSPGGGTFKLQDRREASGLWSGSFGRAWGSGRKFEAWPHQDRNQSAGPGRDLTLSPLAMSVFGEQAKHLVSTNTKNVFPWLPFWSLPSAPYLGWAGGVSTGKPCPGSAALLPHPVWS